MVKATNMIVSLYVWTNILKHDWQEWDVDYTRHIGDIINKPSCHTYLKLLQPGNIFCNRNFGNGSKSDICNYWKHYIFLYYHVKFIAGILKSCKKYSGNTYTYIKISLNTLKFWIYFPKSSSRVLANTFWLFKLTEFL